MVRLHKCIFINVNSVVSRHRGIPQPPSRDLLLIYADDILFAANGPRTSTVNLRLNIYLKLLYDYFCKWDMKLNLDKTNCIIFKGRRGRLFPNARGFIPVLELDGVAIRVSHSIKYLGVIFHEDFEFYRHIDYILLKVRRVYFYYCSLLRGNGGLNRKIRLLFYKQIVRPLMSYAFPIWFGISSHQMERLRIWERRIVSACLNLKPRMHHSEVFRKPSCSIIYEKMCFERIDVFLMRTAIAFLQNSSNLRNSIVNNCLTNSYDLESVRCHRYLSPTDILTLRDAGLLYRDDRLLFYHRRINSRDIDDLVYNTAQ